MDGVDGAGKTVFADELAAVLVGLGRLVIRVTVDAFHNPRAVRYRRGRDDPRGFYLDTFDYRQLRHVLLDPLSRGGDGRYRTAVFDYVTDLPVDTGWRQAPPGAVLVLDGIFLHRAQLRRYWDYSVFLRVGFAVSTARMARRDGGSPDPAAPSNRRYVQGQRLYLDQCRPQLRATVVVDNEDLAAPAVVPGLP